jgi:hypothetical protein
LNPVGEPRPSRHLDLLGGTRMQRNRTVAHLPLKISLFDAIAIPVYQRIASKVLHLRQLERPRLGQGPDPPPCARSVRGLLRPAPPGLLCQDMLKVSRRRNWKPRLGI